LIRWDGLQLRLYSKENIATNKITAIYDRHTVKDYVDLYYLLPEFQFERLEQWASEKNMENQYDQPNTKSGKNHTPATKAHPLCQKKHRKCSDPAM
jgi:predicted nucleotidyltransferase component of viral defense system